MIKRFCARVTIPSRHNLISCVICLVLSRKKIEGPENPRPREAKEHIQSERQAIQINHVAFSLVILLPEANNKKVYATLMPASHSA